VSEQKPSQTVEDYLLLIYTMQRETEAAIPARVSERMGVSPPTALATLRRMERDDLVQLKRGHPVELTDAGREAAESILRRHMLAERLLVDILKLGWADAHQEAHRMEHAISPRVEKQLMALLGNPTTCPHGNPIPGLYVGTPNTKPLRKATEGETLIINNISEHAEEDYELMRYLYRNGLLPEIPLRVEEVAVSNGTISVLVGEDGQRVAVGLAAAEVIQVRERA
jgi:DtxR family transcriptional regulator, Mn-dependent transcriptional regulator